MQNISLAVVDDEPLFREGVDCALSGFPDVHIVAQAGSPRELMASARGAVPQLILLGVPAPGGVRAAIHALRAAYSDSRLLVLCASECRADIAEAFRMGAAGYLHRTARADELIQAVRSTFQQDRYLSPALGAKLLLQGDAARGTVATPGEVAGLNTREAQILAMLRQGLSNKLIAAKLGLSDKTVKHYMTVLFQKLGVRTRLEAVLSPPPNARYESPMQHLAALRAAPGPSLVKHSSFGFGVPSTRPRASGRRAPIVP